MNERQWSLAWGKAERMWGWQRPAKRVKCITRHTALVLLNFYDVFKECRAKHQHLKSSVFDPAKHFDSSDLMQQISDRINSTSGHTRDRIVKREMTKEKVYGHLLFLDRLIGTGALVSIHPVAEGDTHPVVLLGPAGEELCDIIVHQGLRPYIERDRDNWQLAWVWGPMCSFGKDTPSRWDYRSILRFTGLNSKQFRYVFQKIQKSDVRVMGNGGAVRVFPKGCIDLRNEDEFYVPSEYRFASSPTVDVDDEESVVEEAVKGQMTLDLTSPEPVPEIEDEESVVSEPAEENSVYAVVSLEFDRHAMSLVELAAKKAGVSVDVQVLGWIEPHLKALDEDYQRELKLKAQRQQIEREREALYKRIQSLDSQLAGMGLPSVTQKVSEGGA